jgi:hypothetical protein
MNSINNHTDTVAENLEKVAKAIEITQNTLKNLYEHKPETYQARREHRQAIKIYASYLGKLQAQQIRLMSETKKLVYEG